MKFKSVELLDNYDGDDDDDDGNDENQLIDMDSPSTTKWEKQ